jgi:hypothetical protein
LWGLAQVDDELGVPIGQEAVQQVRRVESLVIENTLDITVQGKTGDMYLKFHINL